MIYDLLRMKISDDVKLSSGWVLSRTNRENENISIYFLKKPYFIFYLKNIGN